MPDHQSAAEQHTDIKLPAGWEYAEHKKQQALQAEYQLELHAAHPLYGIDVVVIAYRDSNDDILLQQAYTTRRSRLCRASNLGNEATIRQLPQNTVQRCFSGIRTARTFAIRSGRRLTPQPRRFYASFTNSLETCCCTGAKSST